MNKHLNDGQLRAALDGELNLEELEHFESCDSCRRRQNTIQLQMQPTANKLAFLSTAAKDPALSPAAAWHRFNQQKLTQQEIPMFKKLFAFPLIRFGLPALLILTMIIAIPGTRVLAGELLNLFRVQQVTVVPVDF